MNPPALADLVDPMSPHAVMAVLWTLATAFMVVLMQAGFALLGTGMVRAKNAAHTTAMSFLAFSVGILGYWATGFAFQTWGAAHPFGPWGTSAFCFSPSLLHGPSAALFVSQALAGTIVATIPTGATAERWRLASLLTVSLLVTAVIYPIYAHWSWSGWLAGLGRSAGLGHGMVDVAGGGVVHMTGGTIALVAARVLGPRLGKYSPRGDVRPIPAHNMPMVVLGTFLLAFGWFGLGTGATLAASDAKTALMAVNLIVAGAAAGVTAFFHSKLRFGKPDLSLMCNGFLSGLVGISASGPLVSARSALLIGAVAAMLAIEGALFIERKLRIDDPVGAAAVHGLGGAWSLLAVGIFANGHAGDGWNGIAGPVRGLVAGSAGQLGAAAVAIAANLLWVIPLSLVAFAVAGRLLGNRAAADDEIAGLDVPELGMTGYLNETGHPGAARSSDLPHGRRQGGVGRPAPTATATP